MYENPYQMQHFILIYHSISYSQGVCIKNEAVQKNKFNYLYIIHYLLKAVKCKKKISKG